MLKGVNGYLLINNVEYGESSFIYGYNIINKNIEFSENFSYMKIIK